MRRMCLSCTLASMQYHDIFTLNIFQQDACFCSKLGMQVEYAKSNLKTALSQIWVICQLLPFVGVGQNFSNRWSQADWFSLGSYKTSDKISAWNMGLPPRVEVVWTNKTWGWIMLLGKSFFNVLEESTDTNVTNSQFLYHALIYCSQSQGGSSWTEMGWWLKTLFEARVQFWYI